MPDWPAIQTAPLGGVISSASPTTLLGQGVKVRGAGVTGGSVWPAANRAIYIAFTVESIVTAYQMAFEVTVQSGNLDVGIYSEQGARLVSSGSTAVGGVGVQLVNITDTVLTPGSYFMAMCVDNITAAFIRMTVPELIWMQVSGVQQQAVGAVTLPNPATFANPATAYAPLLSIALNATI